MILKEVRVSESPKNPIEVQIISSFNVLLPVARDTVKTNNVAGLNNWSSGYVYLAQIDSRKKNLALL